jgi:hypothetical protein
MRDTQEIKNFALEVIDKLMDAENDDTEFVIREKIKNNRPLNQHEADYFSDALGGAAKTEMEELVRSASNHKILIETDCMSIYADVWAQYCRDAR